MTRVSIFIMSAALFIMSGSAFAASITVKKDVFPAEPAELASMAEQDFNDKAALECKGVDRIKSVHFSEFRLKCFSYEGNVAYPKSVCNRAGYKVTGFIICK